MTRLPEVHLVAAARPNLPKLAALWHALAEHSPPFCQPLLLHTGQHHDRALFADILADLGLPEPAIALGIYGGSHAELTGRTMIAAEAAWRVRRPALVVVAGDVDGALAAGLAARKMGIPLAHLEAGLRCEEADMPEEINRRALDAISDILWAPDQDSAARLLAHGHEAGRVRAVGNAMVDTLLRHLPEARRRPPPVPLPPRSYGIITLHRPGNVDCPHHLGRLLRAIAAAAAILPLVWPLHPRTRRRLEAFRLVPPPGVLLLPPLRYRDFLALMVHARLIATDSGGVQEEAAILGLPCLTLRRTTERPITLAAGGNRLIAPEELAAAVLHPPLPAAPIPLWDGRAGARMRAHLAEIFEPYRA